MTPLEQVAAQIAALETRANAAEALARRRARELEEAEARLLAGINLAGDYRGRLLRSGRWVRFEIWGNGIKPFGGGSSYPTEAGALAAMRRRAEVLAEEDEHDKEKTA